MLNATAKMENTHADAIEHGNTHVPNDGGAAPSRWTDKESEAITNAVERMGLLGIDSEQ